MELTSSVSASCSSCALGRLQEVLQGRDDEGSCRGLRARRPQREDRVFTAEAKRARSRRRNESVTTALVREEPLCPFHPTAFITVFLKKVLVASREGMISPAENDLDQIRWRQGTVVEAIDCGSGRTANGLQRTSNPASFIVGVESVCLGLRRIPSVAVGNESVGLGLASNPLGPARLGSACLSPLVTEVLSSIRTYWTVHSPLWFG